MSRGSEALEIRVQGSVQQSGGQGNSWNQAMSSRLDLIGAGLVKGNGRAMNEQGGYKHKSTRDLGCVMKHQEATDGTGERSQSG